LSKPVIGLTGPTGAGKSTVAAAFRKLGCIVVDADLAARTIADRPDCLDRLKSAFGTDIVRRNNSLDRQKLAGRAFSSPENTRKLNRITHPAIIAECKRHISAALASECKAVILDAPLLFESGTQDLCDATVAVITPDASRRKRIMTRDGIPEEAARKRMAAQHGNDYYRRKADYTFDGSTDWSVFDEAVGALLDSIVRKTDEKA
jgi:dephospho-CoA kinase